MFKKAPLLILGAATVATISMAACGGDDSGPSLPQEVRMTWFGITNWHYQVGDFGILLDGAVGYPAREPNPTMVTKTWDALKKQGSVDVILLGHLHGDHSVDTPEWAKQTKAQYYGSKAACAEAVDYGVAVEKCTPVYGGETVELNDHLTMRVVRWVHSIGCGQLQNGGGIETFGYLFTADTGLRTLSWYVTDSGAGGPDLLIDQVDRDGVNRGAPLTNLRKAVDDAGIKSFDVWQGGPESRVINQARTVVPTFDVKYFMPHHFGARGGFNLLNGLHYPYVEDEMPKLKDFLSKAGVPQIYATNYFDAFVYDKDGVRQVPNTDVKLAMGLPAAGIGPGEQGVNPRAGQMECDED